MGAGASIPGGRHCLAPSFRGGCRLPCRSGLLGSGWGGSTAGCSGAVPSCLPRQPQLAAAQAQGAAGLGMGPCAGGRRPHRPSMGKRGHVPHACLPTAECGLAQCGGFGVDGPGMAQRCLAWLGDAQCHVPLSTMAWLGMAQLWQHQESQPRGGSHLCLPQAAVARFPSHCHPAVPVSPSSLAGCKGHSWAWCQRAGCRP